MVSHSPSEGSGDKRYNEEEVPHTVPGTKKDSANGHSFKDQRAISLAKQSGTGGLKCMP